MSGDGSRTSKGHRENKIRLVITSFVLVFVLAFLFSGFSLSEAFTIFDCGTSPKCVIIELDAVTPLPTAPILNKWNPVGTTDKVVAVLVNEVALVPPLPDKAVTSRVNNDHQTWNFEPVTFLPGTTINKMELVITAKKLNTNPQTTKISLTVAKGTTLSDLPKGGTPVTGTYVEYKRDLTGKFTQPEIANWRVGGSPTGAIITFGLAQNTDAKDIYATTGKIRINFKDEIKPVTTAQITGDIITDGIYAPGALVTLSCVDPSPGSGVDEIFYTLNGGPETIYSTGIEINQPGPNTILYHCVDNVGNSEDPQTLVVQIQAATVTITTDDPSFPKWKDNFRIDGTTTNTVPNDQVSVDWGDGTTTLSDIDDDDGSWFANHEYGPGTAGISRTVTATVVNGGTAVSDPDTISVTTQRRDIIISLEDIAPIGQGAQVFVRGNARDSVTSDGVLTGLPITFTSSPSVALESATTGAIKIVGDSTITTGVCGSGPDNSIRVPQDTEIFVPGKPAYVFLVFCDNTVTFDLEVTAGSGTATQPVGSGVTNPPIGADGISKIKIVNVFGGGPVEIASLSGMNLGEQALFGTDFNGISGDLSADGKTLLLNDGIFATKGIGPSTEGENNSITAQFPEDLNYNPSNIATKTYTVVYSPGGIGANVVPIADIGDIIVQTTCAADTDSDGICDSFETTGIPYSAGIPTATLYLPLAGAVVGTKDVYVDVDGFTPHVNSGAIDDVVAKYSANGKNLHVDLSDTSISEVATIQIWRDIDALRTNDYDSLKADYFGNAAERATFSGTQTNAGSGTTATFSGISITTPAAAGTTPVNSVHGTITLKMKLNLSGIVSTGSLSQTSATCTSDAAGLNIADSDITSTFQSGASGSQKILTTKIKFKTGGIVSGASLGSCAVTLSLGGTTISSVAAENVSPVLYTEKQLAKLKAYRHIFFAHSIGGPSGRAEIWGNDAVISLGASAFAAVSGHNVGSRDEQAGTFMHELGHLLNLDHGGPRWLQPTALASPAVLSQSLINCKPNYISIMSYSRQLPSSSLSYLNQAAVGGAGGWMLNYSSGLMGNLDETLLNENNGLVSTTSFAPRIVWGTPLVSPYYSGGNVVTPAGGIVIPINWNGDGDSSDNLAGLPLDNRDINNFGIYGCTSSTNTILSDGNDWANMDYRFQPNIAHFGDGPIVDELNTAQLEQLELAIAIFIVIPPPNPNGLEIRNAGSQLPIKLDLQTPSGVDITYATLRAEYYTTNPAAVTVIGSGTYSSAAGHYAIPWKTPRDPGIYHVNVYIENPIPSETDRLLFGPIAPLLDGEDPPNPVTIRVTLE